jgi:thioredoxin 1
MTTVIDFWSRRCPPCRAFKKQFEAWEAKHGESNDFVMVDVDEDEETAADFGVNTLPTVVIVKDNEEVARFEGIPLFADVAPYLAS